MISCWSRLNIEHMPVQNASQLLVGGKLSPRVPNRQRKSPSATLPVIPAACRHSRYRWCGHRGQQRAHPRRNKLYGERLLWRTEDRLRPDHLASDHRSTHSSPTTADRPTRQRQSIQTFCSKRWSHHSGMPSRRSRVDKLYRNSALNSLPWSLNRCARADRSLRQ
jgi:hypothetical protein